MTHLRRGAILLVAALLGGCALLRPDDAAPAPPPTRPVAEVTIDAPDALRTLLETHLDLAKLRIEVGREGLGTQELQRLVAATPAQARALLETEGYFDAQVEASIVDPGGAPAPAPAPGVPAVVAGAVGALGALVPGAAGDATTAGDVTLPRIAVRVNPGPRTLVDALAIDVRGEARTLADRGDAPARAVLERLNERWPLPPGQPFRNELWSAGKSGLVNRLREAGYAAAELGATQARIEADEQRADLRAEVDSGPLYRTGELRITGLQRIPEQPVRDLAGFVPGTPATETLLLDYQERLQQSGLFERATVTLAADVPDPQAAPVEVRLGENPLQELTTAVGVSANTGPRVTLEHTHRKLLDWPLTARNKATWARLAQGWEGELSTYPGDDFYRWFVGGASTREVGSDDTVISTRARLGRTRTTSRIDRLTFAEIEHAIVRTDGIVRGVDPRTSATAVSGNQHVIWRDVDSVLLPTDGQTVSLQVGAGWATSSNRDSGPFARLYGRATVYRPIGATWYGQARLELGQVIRKPGIDVPETLQFRAGGDNSVRGYGYRTLGPSTAGVVGSGNVLMTASAELARPISNRLPSVWGALFVDVGQAATRWTDLKPVVGSGFGVRWRSPVGPLALDLAYGHEVQAWRTHLNVGIAF